MFYDNDAYLGEVQKRTLYLTKLMLILWEKNQQETNLHVWPKGQDMCWFV